MELHDQDIERGSAARVPARRGTRPEPPGAETGTTSASEWHRAGIAVSGVTLVLVIAATIHFITPARRDSAEPIAPFSRAEPAATSRASDIPTVPAIESATVERHIAGATRRSLSRQRPASRTIQKSGDIARVDQIGDTAGLAAPLVADLRVPEDYLRLEPIRLAIREEFVEPPLPDVVDGRSAASPAPAAQRNERRDPVTAALVTAGSAVAGGFRTAGRAVRRVF